MRKGQTTQITVIDEEGRESTVNAQFLGRGMFATCYQVDDKVYSFLKYPDRGEVDYSKDAIYEWADSDNRHIPDFRRMGYVSNDTQILYTSSLYESLTSKHVNAWNDYKIINRVWRDSFNLHDRFEYDFNQRVIDNLHGLVSVELIEGLQSINDACRNYGDYYRFEFPKRNLKVDSNGNLILLDVIFNVKALKWNNKKS